MCMYVILIVKSLWIKASAKCINININVMNLKIFQRMRQAFTVSIVTFHQKRGLNSTKNSYLYQGFRLVFR